MKPQSLLPTDEEAKQILDDIAEWVLTHRNFSVAELHQQFLHRLGWLNTPTGILSGNFMPVNPADVTIDKLMETRRKIERELADNERQQMIVLCSKCGYPVCVCEGK